MFPPTATTFGWQFNLPVSKVVADRWSTHFNAGATLLPDTPDGDLVNVHLGVSVICAVSPTLNFMLESVSNWDEAAGGRRPAIVAQPSP